MQLNLFNGGLSIRLAQHLIGQSCAVECKNVDFEKGTLSPIKGDLDTTQKGERSLYYFNKHWIFADAYRDYVEYQEKLYFSDGQGKPQKSTNGVEFYNLGIDKPDKIPSINFADLDKEPKLATASIVTKDYMYYATYQTPPSIIFNSGFYTTDEVRVIVFAKDANVFKEFYYPKNSIPNRWVIANSDSEVNLSSYIKLNDSKSFYYYNSLPDPLLSRKTIQRSDATTIDIADKYPNYEDRILEGKKLKFLIVQDGNIFTLEVDSPRIDQTSQQAKFVTQIKFTCISEVENFDVYLYEGSDIKKLTSYKLSNTEFYINSLESYQVDFTDIFYFTFYNSKDGTESVPESTEALPSLHPITFEVPKTDDPQVDYVKIYAITASYTQPVLVKTVPIHNKTVSISLKDIASSTSEVLNTYNNYPAPTALQFLTESNSMLFGAVGYNLYYSSIGQPNYWSPYDYISFDDNITGIGATQNGLLVFTIGKTYIITGTSSDTFTKTLLDGGQGCLTHRSVNTINNNLIWLSNDGVVVSSGGNLQNITKERLGKLDLGSVYCCAVYDETYFLSTNKGTLVLDFRYATAFQFLDSIYLGMHRQVVSDTLYGVTPTKNLMIINSDESKFKSLTYKSPKFPSGSISSLKNYKTFYVNSTGNLNFKIYLDDVLVTNIELKGGVEEVRVPQDYMRSYFVQFEVTGVGTLLEIEWQVEDRQNGR